uniref:Uncharacterized protein n=1 Tax=Anguilla anguilla TaxID=7936 RepID=A0A0E9VSI6_ANGAN
MQPQSELQLWIYADI